MHCHAVVLALAASIAAGSVSKEEEGFVSLFNGRDLSGWKEVQGKPGSFWIENGEIHGRRDREKGTAYWLSSEKQYGDFILRAEFVLRPLGNSGIFIRAPGYEGRTSKEGMEIQLRDDGASKGKPDAGHTGAIYSVVAPNAFVAKPAGEWNEIEIRCKGDEVTVTVNGLQINQANMNDYAELKIRPRKGYIGLSAVSATSESKNSNAQA
jgi:hypothetical protein